MSRFNEENLELFYEAAFFVLCGCLLMIHLFCSCACAKRDYKAKNINANQTEDIWNISGRVNHQEGAVTSEPHRWPTHDHHVSIDSFVMPENMQRQKKDRIPPPPYCEVDLPTYEQAIAVPKPKDDLASVHVTPSSSRNCEGQTS